MKYIKEYKMFESNSVTISDEVKECFLPVIDMLYDGVKISIFSKFNSVKVDIEFGDISDQNDLIEEILDSILHCDGYNLDMIIGSVFYTSQITDSIVSKRLEHFDNLEDFENCMKKNSQRIISVKILFRKNEVD